MRAGLKKAFNIVDFVILYIFFTRVFIVRPHREKWERSWLDAEGIRTYIIQNSLRIADQSSRGIFIRRPLHPAAAAVQ